ncbi:MAG: rhodanese-like domain-containing protein [Thermaerobacter sp.]|jgi:rhodanese-related sulfurtransferase|nr:rhodanese-like domain-containing protein [Thermaerobacter sp.]
MMGYGSAFENVTADHVFERLRAGHQIRLIDVRQPHEYHRFRVPQAELLPLHELPHRAHELDREEELYLICHSGNRSAQAAEFLHRQGFPRVKNVLGGMLAWRGPVATGAGAASYAAD